MTVSYGHGIAVTPLHLASAYAALVNGGIWRPATLLKVKDGEVAKGRRVFSAGTSARMRQLLRMIVAVGTGRSAEAKGLRRSEERRVGKECVSMCSYRWWPEREKKKRKRKYY